MAKVVGHASIENYLTQPLRAGLERRRIVGVERLQLRGNALTKRIALIEALVRVDRQHEARGHW
jgi:hypothetical protein